MIRLKTILGESIEKRTIREDELPELLNGKYIEAWNLWKRGIRLYRGHTFFNEKIAEVNPQRGERVSIDGNNIYTVFLGYLPSWEKWPARSHSLIFTNCRSVAEDYGSGLYIVLPENSAQIVIAPTSDVLTDFKGWTHLKNVVKSAGEDERGYGAGALATTLKEICKRFIPTNAYDAHKKFSYDDFSVVNYESLIKLLNAHVQPKSIARYLKMRKLERSKGLDHTMLDRRVINLLKVFILSRNQHQWNWEKFLSDALDPEKNEFELKSISDISVLMTYSHCVEMWTSRRCLLIDEYHLIKLSQYLKLD